MDDRMGPRAVHVITAGIIKRATKGGTKKDPIQEYAFQQTSI
jgi:hypothetical protein